MAQAFRCDRCDEYEDGYPERRKVIYYSEAGIWDDIINGELCEGCAKQLESLTREFFDGEDVPELTD